MTDVLIAAGDALVLPVYLEVQAVDGAWSAEPTAGGIWDAVLLSKDYSTRSAVLSVTISATPGYVDVAITSAATLAMIAGQCCWLDLRRIDAGPITYPRMPIQILRPRPA